MKILYIMTDFFLQCVCSCVSGRASKENVLRTNNREHTFVLIPKLDWKGTDLFLTWSL